MPSLADFAGHVSLSARLAAAVSGRVLIAIAGPPGAGKSTFADVLADALNAGAPNTATVVPMDGFHYDDRVLEARGLRARKGSPATFDVDGLRHLLMRLRARDEAEVAVPVFDRQLEISRAGARIVAAAVPIILVEGNYLLLDDEPWRRLAPLFDVTVMVAEPRDRVAARLMRRWLSFGLSEAEARAKLDENDLPNVDRVVEGSRRAEFIVQAIPGGEAGG